jgi:hypothetical protein
LRESPIRPSVQSEPEDELRPRAGAEQQEEHAFRTAVQAIVADLPTEELLNLRIPLRYVVRHFKAR